MHLVGVVRRHAFNRDAIKRFIGRVASTVRDADLAARSGFTDRKVAPSPVRSNVSPHS